MNVITHYDMLIDENNDPFRDPPVLQDYMSRWDGPLFIEAMKLNGTKRVLEIGVGTGRIAAKVLPNCLSFTGIDISPKTIDRAKENLANYKNMELICSDFSQHTFSVMFDVIYSSLTMMHFEDKQQFIAKVCELLCDKGIFCLSIDKNYSEYIDMGTRKIKIFPDTIDGTVAIIKNSAMNIEKIFETEFAYIIVCTK